MNAALRNIKGRQLIPVLEKLGFELLRKEKDLRVYRSTGEEPITVGFGPDDVLTKRFISAILGDLRMPDAEFVRLLKAS